MSDGHERITKKQICNGKEVDVIYRTMKKATSYDNNPGGWGYYGELNPRTYVENGVRCDQDIPIELEDGTIMYADLYRPEFPKSEAKLPTILCWSFYGKRPKDMPKNWNVFGVPPGTESNMMKFESPDPGYWCLHDYAVLNVDPRGIGNSEGDAFSWGPDEGKDAKWVIDEWIAKQDWSNGKVGMGGNSGVAMVQWYTAAEVPNNLTCIAPWEGCSDMYREFISEGGIPAIGFNKFVMQDIYGKGYLEDHVAMRAESEEMNDYWQSKVPKFENIKIPAYCAAGWSHLHLRGSVNGFRKIKSQKKWLRAHRDFEWPDSYDPDNLDDQKRFFDRYLKDIHNGWELTPRIRIDVMDAYDYDYQLQRSENEFPLKRTEYQKLYLNASENTLNRDAIAEEAKISYDGETGVVNFDLTFDEDTEITGFLKLKLWVEVEGNDDADLFVNVQKLDTKGEWLPTLVLNEPHPGAPGKLRVSHRELDEEESTDYRPVHTHTNIQKLKPGEIVPVEIEIYPTSKIWHKGQAIRVQLAGHYIREGWFEPFSWDTNNKGTHIIHTGGQYDSYLQIPVIPPKYQDGDYIYR